MADDLLQRIRWLEQELRQEEEETEEELDPDEEEEDELGPGYNYAVDFSRAIFADEEPVPETKAPGKKKKGIRKLVFLAILEVLGILAIIGWWLRWLI